MLVTREYRNMSGGEAEHHHRGGGDERREKRRKKKHRDGEHTAAAIYEGVSFRVRPSSSGRPGSPHRFFDDSYDVLFDGDGGGDCGDDGGSDDVGGSTLKAAGEEAAVELPSPRSPKSAKRTEAGPLDDDDDDDDASSQKPPSRGRGLQVVHRHLNGLCVVTAGDVLEKLLSSTTRDEDDAIGDADAEKIVPVGISSVEYLVDVGEGSKSARGKMRARNKKGREKKKHNEGKDRRDDGSGTIVSPRDALCRIVLSDGTRVELRCCVSGTVVELNARLLLPPPPPGCTGGDGAAEGDRDPSLLLSRDPLLDGHLAVILPTRGSFPPSRPPADGA